VSVDVIVTAGTPAILAVKKATSTVPLVMIAVGNPVGTGIVPSVAHPGANITGLSSIAPDLEDKRLELVGTSREFPQNSENFFGAAMRTPCDRAAPAAPSRLSRAALSRWGIDLHWPSPGAAHGLNLDGLTQ
jgi:hypothetical protein